MRWSHVHVFSSAFKRVLVVSQAVRYYRRAAAAGHPRAQYRCAKLLLSSRGQQSSHTDALNFLCAAADAGLTEVQLMFTLISITYICSDLEFHGSSVFFSISV